jgi:hypothetical protein
VSWEIVAGDRIGGQDTAVASTGQDRLFLSLGTSTCSRACNLSRTLIVAHVLATQGSVWSSLDSPHAKIMELHKQCMHAFSVVNYQSCMVWCMCCSASDLEDDNE